MKKTLLALLLALGVVASAQTGFTDQYGNVKGNRTLVRTTPSGSYTIMCSHSNHDVSTFVTRIGSSSYQCPTSTYVEDNGLSPFPVKNKGYHISDMQLADSVCWVCGYVWQETGEWIFNQQGLGYKETRRKGFIGKFNAFTVAQYTSDFFRFVTVDSLAELTRLALTGNGAVAIGKGHDSTTCVVELAEGTNDTYTLKIAKSSHDDEVFMDVVRAGNRVVTLSRYNNPNHFTYYVDYVGLRYGQLTSFTNTANGRYNYNVYGFLNNNSISFTGVDPIFLSATGTGNGVVFSYLATEENVEYSVTCQKGHFVLFHVKSMGCIYQNELFINNDTCTYRRMKDVKCPSPNYTTILLEDSLGNNVFQFIPLNNYIPSRSNKALKLASLRLESICGFNGGLYTYNLSVAGYYPTDLNKTAYLREYSLPGRLNSWSSDNCLTSHLCSYYFKGINSSSQCIYNYTSLILRWQSEGIYDEFKLYSDNTSATRKCTEVQ